MIDILQLRDVKRTDGYDEVWAIVRRFKNADKSPWIKWVPSLSPTDALLNWYLRERDEGRWGMDAFRAGYVPTFLRQLKHDKQALAWLDALYVADRREHKRIALLCFCPDEHMCHRSIVAGLLQGVGCDVRTKSGADYSAYYKQFTEIQ